jgi:hypothetical protein
MKKQFRLLSYIGLAIATAIFILLFANGIPSGSTSQAIALDKPFNDFPENEAQFIDFRLDELSFATLSDREKQDQLRDWLLFTIASDHSLTAEEINQSLYDLATMRQGYMRPVSNFEYGTIRSLHVGNGEVVALIPAGLEPGLRADDLAHIADKHRKDLGKKPSSLVVFEYELHPDQQYGLLTRREVIEAKSLFTPTAGYTETHIETLDDLQQFMEQIDDLTYAKQEGSGLTLGGRKVQGRSYGRIRVEDVAAIWQSEDKIRAGQYPVSSSGFSLDPDYDYASLFKVISAAESGLKKLTVNGKKAISEETIQRAKQGLNPELGNSRSVSLSGLEGTIELPNFPVNPNTPSPQLKSKDIVPYLELIQAVGTIVSQAQTQPNLSRSEINAVNTLIDSTKFHQFQSARYDGYLQGTEVGMVLFYTDLTAKLWTLNYENSSPQNIIQDFVPQTVINNKISSIYKQEFLDYLNTRIWFGPQDKGFQASSIDKSLLFSRNATRIYAASSNPLRPGEETIAKATSEAFLGWWNDHFEEVAAYESQYEQLNEIMKWSLLVSWLNDAGIGDRLSFLQQVSVHRDYWFPDWAKAKGDQLRFQDWESIRFFPRGYLDKTTEVMPILESKSYTFFGNPNWYISGGVSLADKALFQGRKALSQIDDLNPRVYRSTIDYSSLNAANNQLSFSTLEGTAYRLFDQQPTLASVAAQAKEGTKLRGKLSELSNLEFVRNLSRTDDGLNVSTFVNNTELGRLKTARSGNGFKVGWQGRDIDNGQILVQQIQQVTDQPLDIFLKEHPLVSAAAQIDDGSYAIKLHGSDDWMQIAEGGGGSDLPPDWHARVGTPPDDPGIGNILLRWVDDDQVQALLVDSQAQLFVDKRLSSSVLPTTEEIVQNLKQRNYGEIAQQMVIAPENAHAYIHAYIQSELKNIDGLHQSGRTSGALQQLDELIDTVGQQPDLMVKKALLEIDRKRIAVQRIDPMGEIADPIASQEDFYGVINQIYGSTSDKPRFKAIITADEVIYIQDSPTFNNVDPSTPIDATFPFGSESRAYRLESGSIGNAHIGGGGYDTPIGRLIASGDSFSSSNNTFNLGNYNNIPTGSVGDSEDSCKEDEPTANQVEARSRCPRNVYIIIDETTI